MARRTKPDTEHQLLGSETVDLQPFFKSKKAAAVLKHAILAKYIVPFTSKTGSTSTGKRVVIVDGYAGAGRYQDGTPGSPALIAEAANVPALRGRTVECLFVEQDLPTYESLCRVLSEVENGGNLVWEAKLGNVADHLPDLLRRADGVPLFLFLDPFGLGLPLDVIISIFNGRPSGQYVPATEVLFRFDANAIRRIRGALHGDPDKNKGREKTLETLDRAAGGSWWRDEDDPALSNTEYLDWFERRLLSEITTKARCAGWTTVVKQREDLQPAYLLVFLTRHRDGFQTFGDTLSKAQEAWRRAVFDEAFAATHGDGQDALLALDPDAIFKRQEAALDEQLHEKIEQNVRQLLREHEQFGIWAKYEQVYERVEGIARTTHLRKVLKKLHKVKLTTSDGVGDLFSKTVVRAPGAQP